MIITTRTEYTVTSDSLRIARESEYTYNVYLQTAGNTPEMLLATVDIDARFKTGAFTVLCKKNELSLMEYTLIRALVTTKAINSFIRDDAYGDSICMSSD